MEFFAPISVLLLLTFLSGYFSASETALFSLPATKVKAYRTDPLPKKRLIARLLQQPRDLLVTVFMLNTLVNILLQNVASHMFGSMASWSLKVGVPLIITLVFGEIIPKYLGMQNNAAISLKVAPLINLMQNLLAPIRKVIIAITLPLSRILFFFLKRDENISREELQHVLKTSKEYEVLHNDESELVCGYLDLQDAAVKELMRPRQDVLFYDIEEPISKLTYLFVDQACSRIPVCQGTLENIIGIITAREFFLRRKELSSAEKLIKHLPKPFFVPENMLAKVLLRRFDDQNEVIAMVVDEYGSISGLITREDILEVVIGQIADLRDKKSLYTKQNDDEIIASGKLEIDEFNEFFKSDLQSENNMVTMGGWLIEKIGDIPKTGTKFESDGFFFHILTADNNRIRRIYVRRLKSDKHKSR